jgi:hypothetical protein
MNYSDLSTTEIRLQYRDLSFVSARTNKRHHHHVKECFLLLRQKVHNMKACESGFHMRSISWSNSSWLLSNRLLSDTLKTDEVP